MSHASAPCNVTRGGSSMLAASLTVLSFSIETQADRLRTGFRLAVSLSVIGSAFRFDILSSFCAGENKTEK